MELALDDKRCDDFIPCISLYQPWASWVAWGWKTIESRLHERFAGLARREIAIHAGQKWDEQGIYAALEFLTEEQRLIMGRSAATNDSSFPRGAILCTSFVEEFRRLTPADAPRALIECETRRFGLIFGDNVMPLKTPIAARGQRGIWQVRRELIS